MSRHPDAITRLFRACDPAESLQPNDPRYVDCNAVRGGEDVARLFARSLRRADPTRPEVKLFAGHRGVGKTSELYRLKAMLEAPEAGAGARSFQVLYFDVSDVLDVNDLDFPDLLVAVAAQVEENLGAHGAVSVPMIRLRERNSAAAAAHPGLAKLREILERRCAHAELEFGEAFEPAAADHLCAMSGGHPRHLMTFVQAATNTLDALPITLDAAHKAVDNYGNSLLREIRHDTWDKLRRFDQPQDDIPKDKEHQEMLFLLHVFEYMNGRPWYEVNPVLRTLPPFRQAVRA